MLLPRRGKQHGALSTADYLFFSPNSCEWVRWPPVWVHSGPPFGTMLVFNEQHEPVVDIPKYASALMNHLPGVLLPHYARKEMW